MSDDTQQTAAAAAAAADTVAKAASAAALAVSNAAAVASSSMNVDISYIKRDISEIKEAMKGLTGVYITRGEFDADLKPLKENLRSIQTNITWGVRIVVGAVILAVLGFLFTHK